LSIQLWGDPRHTTQLCIMSKVISSPDFTVRQLQIPDAPALAAFYNQLSKDSKRTFRPIGPVTILEKCREIAVDNINQGKPASKYDLVGILSGKIIGWSFIWDLSTPHPTFGLAVADTYHNQGVGQLLMTYTLEWARANGLGEVHLTVVQDNKVAYHLYQKFGFVKTGEFTGDDGQPYYSMVAQLQ
jgi:ribosomal protein S18 acetylase RimI-like enzyme